MAIILYMTLRHKYDIDQKIAIDLHCDQPKTKLIPCLHGNLIRVNRQDMITINRAPTPESDFLLMRT